MASETATAASETASAASAAFAIMGFEWENNPSADRRRSDAGSEPV